MEFKQEGPFWNLYQGLKTGKVSRREFVERAAALGMGIPVILMIINAVKIEGVEAAPKGGSHAFSGFGQAATTGAPAEGTEGQTRGAGGEIKLQQWQGVTHMSLHQSQGTKDTLGAMPVTEPLIHFLPDGSMIPCLCKEVPTEENGLLAPDRSWVQYNLLEGVLWSDGTPFTSADVKFTWEWIVNPANASTNSGVYGVIGSIDTPDDLTVKINFTTPQLSWFFLFGGSSYGAIYPKHILEVPDSINAFREGPIGTGPYKVESFVPGDQVIYVMNENYREPNKPFFSRINLKGGGTAEATAQEVFQTGDWDMAWNLQVALPLLREMEASGGNGKLVVVQGTSLERINFNFSDPRQEVNGQRSEKNTPHPILTDPAVRQAMALAADRETMSNQFYAGVDGGEPPTANVLTGNPVVESPNTSFEFNLEKAAQVLEAAGWVMDGDVRKKGDLELSIDYATTINAVRQGCQAVNKQNWESIGIKVQLKQVDSTIFFAEGAGNELNYAHMYYDITMYTNNTSITYDLNYMRSWYGGANPNTADGSNIAQRENDWTGTNESRYQNPEYDAAFDTAAVEVNAEKAAELFIRMNDILINDNAVIPLVNRSAETYGIHNRINNNNIATSFFEELYWNIANWNLAPGGEVRS